DATCRVRKRGTRRIGQLILSQSRGDAEDGRGNVLVARIGRDAPRRVRKRRTRRTCQPILSQSRGDVEDGRGNVLVARIGRFAPRPSSVAVRRMDRDRFGSVEIAFAMGSLGVSETGAALLQTSETPDTERNVDPGFVSAVARDGAPPDRKALAGSGWVLAGGAFVILPGHE
ncbi:MAG: hypothetical protein IJR99_06390, partial [Kiritimatiellae bacterium]|nr:hypothetical protein [Kiritimatiellia bacterium]